jgi:hypothetical protein
MQAAESKLTGQVGGYKKVTKVKWKIATSAYIAQQAGYVCVWCISRLKLSETNRFLITLITNSSPLYLYRMFHSKPPYLHNEVKKVGRL